MSKGESVSVAGLSKRLGATLAVDGVSFSVEEGEVLALLGPSGSGKTTTMHLVAGLETPDAGSVRIAGIEVAGPGAWVPPHRRNVALVFQHLALWPHMTAAQHLEFVLRARDVPRGDRQRRIGEVLEAVRLGGCERSLPSQLSGGECQRLSLARALVVRPAVLLLDEPCSHLDASLREAFLLLLADLRRRWAFTAIHVTHDADEAFATADRLAVLEGGRLVQVGKPEEIYRKPGSPAVARLLGPGLILDARPSENGGWITDAGPVPTLAGAARGPCQILIRPELLKEAIEGKLAGRVVAHRFQAGLWIMEVEIAGQVIALPASAKPPLDRPVRLSVAGEPWVFPDARD